MSFKKGIFTILMILTTTLLSVAQFANCKLSEIAEFKKNGILIVAISDDELTNKTVQEIMTGYWTTGKFNVIKRSELSAYMIANPQNYVLTYLSNFDVHDFKKVIDQTKSSGDAKVVVPMQILGDCLILAKNLTSLDGLKLTDAMINCYIDYEMQIVNEQAEFTRQVGAINAILTFPVLVQSQIGGWKIPTISQKDMIEKELWIADIDINKNVDQDAMKSVYQPYKYKIVSKEEIAKAIIEKRKGIIYLAREEYKLGVNLFMIHQAEDNKILFFVKGEGRLDATGLEKIKNNAPHAN